MINACTCISQKKCLSVHGLILDLSKNTELRKMQLKDENLHILMLYCLFMISIKRKLKFVHFRNM